MKTYGDKFIVKYNKGSIRNYDLGGIVIEISAECDTDIRGNSEQFGTVVCVPVGHEFLKPGDSIITHYLSSNDGNAFDNDGETLYRVTEREIFAKIHQDDTLEPLKDIYFCEQVKTEAITSSGIYLTTDVDIKEPMKLKVTHVPSSLDDKWIDDKINVGDLIMSQDDFQYTFNYNKKTYIKIEQKFISGVFVNE